MRDDIACNVLQKKLKINDPIARLVLLTYVWVGLATLLVDFLLDGVHHSAAAVAYFDDVLKHCLSHPTRAKEISIWHRIRNDRTHRRCRNARRSIDARRRPTDEL